MRCRMIIRSVVLVFLVGWMNLAAADAAAQGFPNDNATKAERLFVRGMTKAYINDHAAALALFQKALDLTPNAPAILSAMAVSEEALDNRPMALFYAEQARFYAPDNAHYHHQLAQLYLRTDDLIAAALAYDTLLERFPNDVEALEDLAELQATMGRHADAIATYERLIERAGDRLQLRRQVLQLYFDLGDEEGTRRSLEALIEMEPTDPAPYRLLGQLYLQQQKQQDALQAFEQAYTVDATDLETVLALSDLYRQMGRADDADRLFAEAMNVEDATVEELMARATPLYQRAGEDDEAARTATHLLERAVEQVPDHAGALLMLGDLRYQTGAYTDAAQLLERALAQNPRDLGLWQLAAAAYLEAGRPEDAARIADEGLLLFPGQLPLLRVAALSLLHSGRNDEAIARFEEALVLYEEEDAPAAERSEALGALGLLFARKQDYDQSDRYYRQALDADPNNALALNNYANDLAEQETRLAEAQTLAQRAVDLDPQNASFLDTLGWIYFKQEAYAEAKTWIGKAIATGQASATVYEHYGDVHARLGDTETARQHWRKALEMAPGNQALQEKLERQQF